MLGGLVHRVVRTIGVEQQARQVRRALQPRWRRRNWDDDEQLRRLLLLGLRSDSHCIDVGANVGVILGWMEAAAPHGRHIAFEPVPVLNRPLAERHPSVDVRADAVSDEAGTATFTVVRDAMSRSGLDPLGVPSHAATEQIEVRTVRLDDVLPDDFHPRLVKIDVEGTELQALKGARSTLASHDVLLALEHGHGSKEPDLARSAELYDLLRGECRLRVFDMRGNEFDAAGFRTAYLRGSCWNFLARR